MVLLGIAGMRLVAVGEVDGELELTVETTAVRTGCGGCGVVAVAHGRRETVVRDVAGFGRAVRLRWRKRLWRCPEPACGARTWSERSAAIPPRSTLTERARRAAAVRVAQGESVAKVARELGVGWATVMRAVTDYGQAWLADTDTDATATDATATDATATDATADDATADDVAAAAEAGAPAVLGLDEHVWQRGRRLRRTRYATGFVDAGCGRLLDLVQGRSTAAAVDWLADQTPGWRTGVGVACVDPFEGYATAVRRQLPHATLVVDRFHAVRLGNQAVDDVRRRVQQTTTGHRGRTGDPLYRVRRLLLLAADRLDSRGLARLEAAWAAADPDHEVYTAWAVKELLRDVYAAADLDAARDALEVFYDWARDSAVPECRRLARTVRRWQAQILAWHTTGGASNGPTEAVNLLIKKINRVAHGFRNWDNYRLRVLLHCKLTWHNQPATRIRGRATTSPRLAA